MAEILAVPRFQHPDASKFRGPGPQVDAERHGPNRGGRSGQRDVTQYQDTMLSEQFGYFPGVKRHIPEQGGSLLGGRRGGPPDQQRRLRQVSFAVSKRLHQASVTRTAWPPLGPTWRIFGPASARLSSRQPRERQAPHGDLRTCRDPRAPSPGRPEPRPIRRFP